MLPQTDDEGDRVDPVQGAEDRAEATARTQGHGWQRPFERFACGCVAQACRVAGMKRPRAWSSG